MVFHMYAVPDCLLVQSFFFFPLFANTIATSWLSVFLYLASAYQITALFSDGDIFCLLCGISYL